jgi:TFIIF-interacting CTD phosphatase-like protein
MNCYFGIKYIRRLKHLTSEQKIKYKLSLPTDNLGQKTLFLDLDETLIHASTNTEVRF